MVQGPPADPDAADAGVGAPDVAGATGPAWQIVCAYCWLQHFPVTPVLSFADAPAHWVAAMMPTKANHPAYRHAHASTGALGG